MTHRSAALAASALLAACATTAPPEGGLIAGRLALHVEAHGGEPARSLGAAFELRGSARTGSLRLATPLGTTIAQASWRPGEASLRSADGEQRFADLDALAQQLLGEPLPLAALFDWLRARPWPGAPSQPGVSGFGQLGWSVDLARYADGAVLVQRAQPPVVTLRVRLDAEP